MADELRIMIAAGGTGGHVFPAIAIADAIRQEHPQARILFVGTRDRMEWKAVPAAGYDIAPIWISGLHRRLTLKNLLFPLKLLVSLWQSFRIVRRFKPHAMISCGGFVAGPAGWTASLTGVPLFLQEQNSFPGVTNRKLASRAERIYTAFEEAGKWFPEDRIRYVGNPVRRNLMNRMSEPKFAEQARQQLRLDPAQPVLLVMGGSGGAKSINEAMIKHLPELHDSDEMQIIWQCGPAYFDEIKARLADDNSGQSRQSGLSGEPGQSGKQQPDLFDVNDENISTAFAFTDTAEQEERHGAILPRYPNMRLFGFLDDITGVWAASDIILSRAGASTCAELLATGKTGILVPSPWVAGDHQTHNAKALAGRGAAVLLKDDELSERLPDVVRDLICRPSRRKEMERQARFMAKPDAAMQIAREILDYTGQQEQETSKAGSRQNLQITA